MENLIHPEKIPDLSDSLDDLDKSHGLLDLGQTPRPKPSPKKKKKADDDDDIIWDVKADRYRVKIGDQWIDIPDYAKLDDANIVGRAIVWVWWDQTGVGTVLRIRCFLPGAEL